MLKKLTTFFLALCLTVCLVSCDDDENKKEPEQNGPSDVTERPDGGIDLPMVDVPFN